MNVVLDSGPCEMLSFTDVIMWIAAKCGMKTTLPAHAYSRREVNRVPLGPADSMFVYPSSTDSNCVHIDIENDFNNRPDRVDNEHMHTCSGLYALM